MTGILNPTSDIRMVTKTLVGGYKFGATAMFQILQPVRMVSMSGEVLVNHSSEVAEYSFQVDGDFLAFLASFASLSAGTMLIIDASLNSKGSSGVAVVAGVGWGELYLPPGTLNLDMNALMASGSSRWSMRYYPMVAGEPGRAVEVVL